MVDIDLNLLKETFKTLAKIYSPSKNEKEVCDYVVSYLKDLGCSIYLDNSYDKYCGNCPTIFSVLKGNKEGGVTLSAHIDVVEPNKGLKIIDEGHIIKTDGTTTLGGDDKAGVAVILYALKYLVDNNIDHEDIYCIITPGEEAGMLGARNINWDEVYKHINPAKNTIVLDNAGKSEFIAHQAPSCNKFEITVHGKKAHAGIEPEKGISAIKVISEIIEKLEFLRIDDLTTANISYLHSDFPTNVVSDLAVCKGEVRSHSYEKIEEIIEGYKSICSDICSKYNCEYDFVSEQEYPLLRSLDDLKFAKEFQKYYKKIGVDSKLQVIGGGSDANFYAAQDFNAIIIGVGMQQVHTTDEYLEVEEMKKAASVLLEYLMRD